MTEQIEKIGSFQLAKNNQAYLKAGILGFAKSGKTFTSALMAKGISERLGGCPVLFLDTETGSDFLVDNFKRWDIPFYVQKSRAFTDLLDAVKSAEQQKSVLIIDSISHFWKEVTDAYKKAKGRTRLQFQDWDPIKMQWARFTDLYLSSKVHIIMCGRAGYEYDYFEDDAGQKQLEKTGTKMKAEAEMGFEPSLLLEMVRERRDNKDGRVEAKLWDHACYVLGDRSQKIEGKKFIDPTFQDFAPHFDYLNIGGEHIGVDSQKSSAALFEPGNDDNVYEQRKQRQIFIEEIEGELMSKWPGQSAAEKKARQDAIFEVLGTRAWTALPDMPAVRLKDALDRIRQMSVDKMKEGEIKNGTH